MVGPASYKLLRSLLMPKKPTEKTFEQLAETFTKYYSTRPSEIMQCFRFNTRSRKENESVAAYVAELRRLAEFCNFGTTLEKMLHDRLVYGINDPWVQKKLLAEQDLRFAKALAIAQGSESADRNLKELASGSAITVKR